MGYTWKYLEKKARETYIHFSQNFYPHECPFGNEYSSTREAWCKELMRRLRKSGFEEFNSCGTCPHFFKYKIVNSSACPCPNMGDEKAFRMLKRYVKKWTDSEE